MFQKIRLHPIMLQKIRLHPIKLLLMNQVNLLVLACLGDEPYNEQNRRYIVGADWMMCEAFCLYADRDTFKPYEKCHSTALDPGKLAEELGVKNLILYHTEEKTSCYP